VFSGLFYYSYYYNPAASHRLRDNFLRIICTKMQQATWDIMPWFLPGSNLGGSTNRMKAADSITKIKDRTSRDATPRVPQSPTFRLTRTSHFANINRVDYQPKENQGGIQASFRVGGFAFGLVHNIQKSGMETLPRREANLAECGFGREMRGVRYRQQPMSIGLVY